MKKYVFFSMIMTAAACYAQDSSDQMPTEKHEKRNSFYLKFGSGASFSTTADISAPSSVWDPAIQGYDASLGTAPIFLSGIGYDTPFVMTDITMSYRPNYTYRKYQVPTTNTTPGTIGTTTRKFDLDVTSILWNVMLSGRGFSYSYWKTGNDSAIFPFVGGGVGGSQMKIFNFRSTGLAASSDSDGFPTFASENQYTVKYEFTWQLMGGFEFRYKDLCSLAVGYRWFDVAQFNGPEYIRDQYGNAIDVGNNTWKINFAANEAFLELKVFL